MPNPQGGRDTLITNIYAPNSLNMAYFIDLTTWFAQSNYYQHVVGGDFNSIMHRGEDRKNPANSSQN